MAAAPCAPWHCVRGPVRKSGVTRPFNRIVSCHSGPVKNNLLYIVVVGAALTVITYFAVDRSFLPVVVEGTISPSGTVEGEILAIETVSRFNYPDRKELVVKLTSGERVRAYLPPACVAFTGQIAKLSAYPGGFYTFKESREKNDS
jgi:hypothetical protein